MSSLPQVGDAPSPSTMLETLRQRQKKRQAGETLPVTQVLEQLEQVVIQQAELLQQQEQQLQQQEEAAKQKIAAIQKQARDDRDDLIAKIKEFASAMDLQVRAGVCFCWCMRCSRSVVGMRACGHRSGEGRHHDETSTNPGGNWSQPQSK